MLKRMKKKLKKDGKVTLYKDNVPVKVFHKIAEFDDEELGAIANTGEQGRKGKWDQSNY